GLVVASLLCREIIRVLPKANFRLMVASAYGGFLLFHGGFSASIPLIVATKGNFSEEFIGRLIPIQETLFSPLNLFLCGTLVILIPLTVWYISKVEKASLQTYTIQPEPVYEAEAKSHAPAEKLEHSRLICLLAGGTGLAYLFIKVCSGTFSLELSYVCFVLLFLAISLLGPLLIHLLDSPPTSL
ncbi:MAG: TIGR00366 family protein, partial [Alphaproteobacteria bacterium]